MNPIDAFVRARLKAEGLTPSKEADHRTLIRRVSFDLIGLPPTPREIDAFVADPAHDAYDRLVDRLLASPRYGERWARHWLDVVHYGDTHGFDKDKVRPNAWPYRDYVIREFNQDKPWARFVREQLAGDVIFPGDPDGIVATGFIAAGPWDAVGQIEVCENTSNGAIVRNLDRDDMVMNTMSTFTSLTVHCARCHNHKFDPITQQDYYSLQAVFAGIGRADRPYDDDPSVARHREELARRKHQLEKTLARVEEELNRSKTPEVVALDKQIEVMTRLSQAVSAISPTNGYHSAISPESQVIKWVQVDLGRSVPIDRIRLWPARPTDFPDTPGFGFPVRFRVEACDDSAFGHPILLFDAQSTDYANPGNKPVEVPGAGATARFVRVTATRLWKRTGDFVFALGEMEVESLGHVVSRGAPVAALDSIEAGRWTAAALVDGYDSRGPLPAVGEASRARVVQQALKEKIDRREQLIRNLNPRLQAELSRTKMSLDEVTAQVAALPPPRTVYAAAARFAPVGYHVPPPGGQPRPIHVLFRGNLSDPRELVGPGAVAFLPGANARFQLPDLDDEGSRRAALAEWIVDRRNPLTWRSIVNRVWHYHFGHGIVETTNDFGHMGALPSNLELLDWLASEFRDGGDWIKTAQSIKSLQRLIVTSATYRQSAQGNVANEKIDAGNRFLWRMNRRRLEAEAIRDSVLSVSGKLDLTMGGPGYFLFGFIDDHSPHYLYDQHDPDDPRSLRRTIYRFIVRSVPDPFMTTLDCPDPSIINDKRFETVTALQSLAMLNDTFMVRQARHFAERLRQITPELPGQVDAACKLALGRAPTPDEAKDLLDFAQKNGLPNFCRLIFNLNEFVFVE